MPINLKQHIDRTNKKRGLLKSSSSNPINAIKLEIQGMFKNNIGKDRITPKTIKKKGKTLYDTGLGLKSIVTIYKKFKLITGNSRFYMQYHLPSDQTRKKIPERNWLIKPPKLDEVMQDWIRNFMRL